MRRPAFLEEIALPQNRPKLWVSVRSGYATAGVFGLLTLLAYVANTLEAVGPLAMLVVAKMLTNTLQLWALKRDRFVLDAGTLNVTADVLCMTGAIYYTGCTESPLFTMYVIEISVVALLTNLGTTLLVAGSAVALYGTMAVLVHKGILHAWPSPRAVAGGDTALYVLLMVSCAALVLGIPTFHTARILTLLREKERALEQRAADLVDAGKQKSQFMANVTHELRTPIQGICGLSDLVETGIYGPVSDKQKTAHQGIKRSAKSLLALIDDLLELSRADAGKMRFSATEVPLLEVCESVVASARWLIGTKPLTLVLDAPEPLPTLFTDRAKLSQTLLNLLANAVKFTPEGGTITVRARTSGENVVIEVEDTGIGIPDTEHARVFEEFRQVDGSSERAYGGVGLGLALVKRLTTMLGGEVSLSSEPGRGSTFRVTLPQRATIVEAA